MPHLTLDEVVRITGGRPVGDGSTGADRIVGDSREASASSAFVAIRGGHDFVASAVSAGAPFVVVERGSAVPTGSPAVVVDDSVAALRALGAAVRPRLAARAIGITGSVGKTLTKDLVAAAIGARRRVHASPRSFNTEIGVPLVLLGCPDDADVLVVELGARHRGEIAELSELVQPEIGIITTIGQTHLGEFGSRRAIAETKSELLSALGGDGLALVGADCSFLALLSEVTRARMQTVGAGGHVRYRAHRIGGDGRTEGSVWLDGRWIDVVLPLPGRALMRNAAFALAAATEMGVDPSEAAAALGTASTSSWRMELSQVGPWHLINDAYNANPTSMAAAMRTARELAGDAPLWAVLGEMAELGPIADVQHRRMGRLARSLSFDGVIAVGGGAADAYEGSAATSLDEAVRIAADEVPEGGWILVKGSRVAGLERFADRLAEHDRTVEA